MQAGIHKKKHFKTILLSTEGKEKPGFDHMALISDLFGLGGLWLFFGLISFNQSAISIPFTFQNQGAELQSGNEKNIFNILYTWNKNYCHVKTVQS